MRILARCPRCHRQTDVSTLSPGTEARCRCGESIAVPAVAAGDAAVVRCSSCGAPREEGSAACGYCGADFTIHEQDLETICPSCLSRVSDRARFCSTCGSAIAAEESADSRTDRICPACGGDHSLRSRALGETGLSVLECERCAGLWLGEDAFKHLCERARVEKDPEADPRALRDARGEQVKTASFYRPCPVCKERMNRRNFGRRSGVIIDECRHHGIWFDASELHEALRWIKAGGEEIAEERERQEERTMASAARFRVEPKTPEDVRLNSSDNFWSEEQGLLPLLTRMLLRR